jgi:transcription elongation factor Elf1
MLLMQTLCQGVVNTKMKEELGSLFCFFCGRKLTEKNVEVVEVDATWDHYIVDCPTCYRQYEVEI